MPALPNAEILAAHLPGRWLVRASNLPQWLGGTRSTAVLQYTLLSDSPMSLREELRYDADGRSRAVVGTSRLRHGQFSHRRLRSLSPFRRRWTVAGMNDEGSVAALRFTKSIGAPAGIQIISRDGAEIVEPRALVAADAAGFGLSPEDFASLSWLD